MMEKQEQFSPGPWTIEHECIFDTNEKMVADLCRSTVESTDEAVANVRLVSAAPDLLHALEMVRDADNDCRTDGFQTIPPMARGVIDRAIAKAKFTENTGENGDIT